MPLTNTVNPDPDADLAISVIDLQEANKKQIFLRQFFCLLLFSKLKSPKKVTKQKESWFFLLCLLDDTRIRIHTSD
jgi:hypothetical protein